MPEPYYRRQLVHPRGSQGGADTTRAGDADLAEAEALRLDDLMVWEKGDFGQREPERLLHLPDGWRQDDMT